MPTHFSSFVSLTSRIALAALTLDVVIQAADPTGVAVSTTTATATPLNGWLQEQSSQFEQWDVGAAERFRFESKNYFAANGRGPLAVDFNADSPAAHNNYTLFRTRVWVGYAPTEWISGYVQAQSSLQENWAGTPPPGANGPIGLYQYYAIVGDPKQFPVTLKVGRQELSYGNERLVGASNWDNLGRAFDAAKLRYAREHFWVDAFAGSLVLPVNQGTDIVNWDEVFWGLYSQANGMIPKTTAEFYFLGDNANSNSQNHLGTVQKGNPPRDIYTLGTHLKSLPGSLGNWDYDVEVAGQLGQYQYPKGTPLVVNGEKLDQQAYAFHLEGGYTFKSVDMKPRVGLIYNQGSGDSDPYDDKHQTFVNLYPTNHKFYGFMDFFAWQNMQEIVLTTSSQPIGKLNAKLDFHVFRIQDTYDFSYNAAQTARTTGGYGIQPNNKAGFGQELDFVLTYPICKWAGVESGYGHFFTGAYVDASLAKTGGAHDADWYYLQLNASF